MNPSRRILPPQELLKSLISYDPDTGEFRWIKTRCHRATAGNVAGTRIPNGYIVIGILGQLHLAHRLAWQITFGECPPSLDHVNQQKHDNRICNLRPATQSENGYNVTVKKSASPWPRGVYRVKSIQPSFRAQIKFGGKHLHLGCFPTPEEAGRAYQQARKDLCGEFAPTV